MGTLKSTRISTRFSRRSRSDIFRTGMAYLAAIRATVTSSIRLLNPHSLSYQEDTFTSVPPDTLVSVASKIEEAGLWLKSDETSGSLLYSRTPFKSDSDACFSELLTSSTVVGRFATKENSTIEPLLVGSRMA